MSVGQNSHIGGDMKHNYFHNERTPTECPYQTHYMPLKATQNSLHSSAEKTVDIMTTSHPTHLPNF